MIEICWLTAARTEKDSSEEFRTGIQVKGHAGFDSKGKDIVCAGFSTLFFTLLEMIKKEGYDTAAVSSDNDWIEIRLTEKSSTVQHYWKMFLAGVDMLNANYPQSFRVNSPDEAKQSRNR